MPGRGASLLCRAGLRPRDRQAAADQVGDRLEQAQASHQGAMQKLFQGPGNLVSQAEKLRKLGSVETPLAADAADVEAALESDAAPLALGGSEVDSEPERGPDSSPNLPAS